MDKLTKPKDIKKLREAFRVQYTKFQEEYNDLGLKLRQMTIDADCLLAAMEEVFKLK